MTGLKTVLCLIGTRPEAVKMAPLLQTLQSGGRCRCLCCLSGQHIGPVERTLALFGLEADFRFRALEPGQSLTRLVRRILEDFEPLLDSHRPDLVLVHGDTATAFAGAMAAYHRGIPVGHVEAGLRSGDPTSPFPEEIYRQMIDGIGSLLFAPTAAAVDNLRREKVRGKVLLTGNTVQDAMDVLSRRGTAEPVLPGVEEQTPVVLLTCHRRENRAYMPGILEAARRILEDNPSVRLVVPMHPDPALQKIWTDALGDHPRAVLLPAVDVARMHGLLRRSCLVLTDSGGLQEEAPACGKPVLLLRNNTERPEGIAAGAVEIVGTSPDKIVSCANRYLRTMPCAPVRRLYGDGDAAEKIARGIYEFLDNNTPGVL